MTKMGGCSYDVIDSTLDELEQQFGEQQLLTWGKMLQYLDPDPEVIRLRQLLHSVRAHIKKFRIELRFLLIFLDYIRKRTKASLSIEKLALLAVEIEAAIQDAIQLLSNFDRKLTNSNEWGATKFFTAVTSSWKSTDLKKKDLEERSSRLIDVLADYMLKIESLRKKIKLVYPLFSGKEFNNYSPLDDYALWDKFVGAIFRSFQALRMKLVLTNPLTEQIKAFEDRLSGLRFYLGQTYKPTGSFPHDPRIVDFMNHVGLVAIGAAHVSVWCWCEDEYLEPENEVNLISLSDNGQKTDYSRQEIDIAPDLTVLLFSMKQDIDLTNYVFLELNLGFLKAFHDLADGVFVCRTDLFAEYVFDKTADNGLASDLKWLISFYIQNFDEPGQVLECSLAEIKNILSQVASLNYILFKGSDTRLMCSQLLGKMWLVRAEIFLMKQLNSSSRCLLSSKDEISSLEDRMKSIKLKTTLDDPEEESEDIRDAEQRSLLIGKVAHLIASVDTSFCANEITQDVFVDAYTNLLLKILLFKSESYLLKCVNSRETFLVTFKDRFVVIHKGVKFLMLLVANQPEENFKNTEMVFTLAEDVARKVIFLYFLYPYNISTEESSFELAVVLRSLIKKIILIKDVLDQTYLSVPISGFPTTNGLCFINLLSQHIKLLLDLEDESISHVKDYVQEILRCLEFLKPFVNILDKQNIEPKELKDFGAQIVNASYQTEYVIDSILIEHGPKWQRLSWLYDISEDVRYLEQKAVIISQHNDCAAGTQIDDQTSRSYALPSKNPEMDDDVVSLSDEEEILVDRLTRGSKQRVIVPIVGMPGIGKTTLAKRLYNNPNVTFHFHIYAWCSVTQVYRKRELLLGILSHIGNLADNLLEMADEDLEMELYRRLKQKRYLIVMDDVWNIVAWNDLERSFPNDGNGSRILITSRISDLMMEAKMVSDPHYLRLLSFDESWALLQMKIFHEHQCPEELVEVGKQISEKCKGLPLAVVAIAGLLKRTDKNINWWRSIADNLSSRIIDDPQTRCMDILELSYKHLPDHLKGCFLYFGAFLGDKEIQVDKLILLWISEGFVVETESRSSEDLAEDHLMDLIGRSLVKPAKRSSIGRVKTCRIHDLLRDLCIAKAKEEKFLRLITGFDQSYPSYDGLDYGVDFEHCGTSSCTTYEDYRLCFRSKRRQFFMSRPFGPRVRSLLFFAANDMYPRCPYDISFIFGNFMLLKVLDLEAINLGSSFPSGLVSLILLRYLAVSGDIDSLPSSISQLVNLKTLVVKGLKGKVAFPDSIWYMGSLRHILVTAIFSLPDDKFPDSWPLDNLVTLSSLSLSHREDARKIIIRLPNLRKLRFIFSDSGEDYRANYPFPRLDILTKLESLNICYYGRAFDHSEFCFPVNLRKLTLSNFRLPWECVSVIGRLQNLEVLKLNSRAFEGESWEMEEGEFLKLRYLKLDKLNLVNWIASSDHLPNLQQLVLRNCRKLNEVPSSFADIPTLQIIEVQWCGHSAEESVRRIEEEGIEGLKVLVNFSDLNSGSAS